MLRLLLGELVKKTGGLVMKPLTRLTVSWTGHISKRKPDINILLVLYVAILVALGALGVATKAGVGFVKTAKVQTTTSPGVKIVDGLAAQSK